MSLFSLFKILLCGRRRVGGKKNVKLVVYGKYINIQSIKLSCDNFTTLFPQIDRSVYLNI